MSSKRPRSPAHRSEQPHVKRPNPGSEPTRLYVGSQLHVRCPAGQGVFGGVGLYDSSGTQLLAAVPSDVAELVTVYRRVCAMRVADDGSALVLTCWTTHDNRDELCDRVRNERKRVHKESERELVLLNADILGKVQAMADCYKDTEEFDTIAEELKQTVLLKGLHEERFVGLGPDKDVSVRYDETREGGSVVLALGQLCRVPFFPQPVVFLRVPLEILEAKTQSETVSRTAQLLAWRGRVPRCTFALEFATDLLPRWHPSSVAVGGDYVYAVEQNQHRISVHELDGTLVSVFGSLGFGDGNFNHPTAVCPVGEHLWVVDAGNHRIVVVTHDGTFVRTFGSAGSDDGQLSEPQAIALAGQRVYVADTHNHRVSVYDLDGAFEFDFGDEGSGDGEFMEPTGVAVGGNSVFVADESNDRICVHTLDGNFVRAFGGWGSGDGQFAGPRNLVVVGQQLVVVDYGNERLTVHNLDGTFIRAISSQLDGQVELPSPLSVAWADGELYVAHSGGYGCISRFR
jgi:DNA-binding beta-propeller fold protein YncE